MTNEQKRKLGLRTDIEFAEQEQVDTDDSEYFLDDKFPILFEMIDKIGEK